MGLTKWFTTSKECSNDDDVTVEKLFDLNKYDIVDYNKDWISSFPIRSDSYKEPDFILFNQNHICFHEQHIMETGKSNDDNNDNQENISFIANNDDMRLSSSIVDNNRH